MSSSYGATDSRPEGAVHFQPDVETASGAQRPLLPSQGKDGEGGGRRRTSVLGSSVSYVLSRGTSIRMSVRDSVRFAELRRSVSPESPVV